MASGLEVVVRPVVFPNIRPQTPRILPPINDPEQGFATIGGGGGKVLQLTHSYSFSLSRNKPHQETKRESDIDRVYQKKADGTINRSNFIDIKRPTKIKATNGGFSDPIRIQFRPPAERDNVETIETGITEGTGAE